MIKQSGLTILWGFKTLSEGEQAKIPLVKNLNIVYQILFVGLFISLFILGFLWFYGILKF